jgi:hypothetical protein
VKRWQITVLVLLAVAGIVYVYLHRQDFGLVATHIDGSSSDISSTSSSPAHITWETVNRGNEGFRVDLPVDSKEIQVPAYNEAGGTEPISMIISYPNPETTFSVAWEDRPPVYRVSGRSPDRTLDMARDGALIRTQTSLVSESRDTPDGNPTREIVAHNGGGGVMDSRLILVGERLYMLTAAFPSGSARREQDVRRFFNSFRIGSSRIPDTLPLAPAPVRRD